jgi:hypothetical protein
VLAHGWIQPAQQNFFSLTLAVPLADPPAKPPSSPPPYLEPSDEEIGPEPDSGGYGQPELRCEEAVGRKTAQHKTTGPEKKR